METITASLKIDSKQAEQKLETVREKIAKLEKDIGERKEKQEDLNAEADRLSQEYQKALDKLEELKRLQNDNSISGFASRGAGFEKEIAEQEKVVADAEKNYGKARQAAEKYYDYTLKKEEDLKYAQERAGQLVQQMEAAKTPAALLAKRTGEIKDNTDRIFNRIKGLFRRVLFFSVIAKGIRMIRDYIVDVVKVNPKATEAIARLKGSLLTLAQPIVEFVVPALIKLINAIIWVINRITAFFATLSGKTIGKVSENAKALYEQTKALNATGKAAKEAKKQLAGFDELNILNDKDNSGGADEIAPIFPDENDGGMEWVDFLERNLNLIKLLAREIGLIIGAWTISKNLGLGLTELIGLFFIIDGLVGALKNVLDILNNGANWENISMLALHIVEIGAGIAILVGSWIPLLIAAITSVILFITQLGGTAGQVVEGIKQIFEGLAKFFKGVFTGDMKSALDGLKTMFKGVFNVIIGVFGGFLNAIVKGINWLIDKINTIHFEVPDWVPLVGGKSVGFNLRHVEEIVIPKLAQGTIVPPNREFLAMLGDNKTEQEVVSPLSTMKQAFLEAMRESGGGDRPVNIYLDGKLLASTTTKYQTQFARARG